MPAALLMRIHARREAGNAVPGFLSGSFLRAFLMLSGASPGFVKLFFDFDDDGVDVIKSFVRMSDWGAQGGLTGL